MHTFEILNKKISVTKLPNVNMQRPKAKVVQERPAAFGHFTIGQLVVILNEIQMNPFKERHSFAFGDETFIVRVYQPDSDETE